MPPLPPVTKALMLICTAVFLVQALLPILPVDQLFALWPLGSGRFWPWQLLSYSFLHGDVMHLFFNMLGLWVFGADLERLWGRNRYIQMLLASVVAGLLWDQVGAEATFLAGAAFAVLALAGMSWRRR